MYIEENRRRINWGNVLRKCLTVILLLSIMFVVIWMISGCSKRNNIDVNYDNNNEIIENNNNNNTNGTNNSDTNNMIYSDDFVNGYDYVHSSAKDYFLMNEVPSNGNAIKYTLQELIDKNIILESSYINKCDKKLSYVIIRNIDGDYSMNTSLVCGKEIATTTEKLRCNLLCNGKCEQSETTEIEYEFKQAYKENGTVYSCPAGYTKSGSKCYKSVTIKPTIDTTYKCKNGATPTADHKCPTTTTTYTDATVNTIYTCSNGATPTNDHKCANGSSTTYTCSEGSLSGTSCVITSSYGYYTSTQTYMGGSYNGCSYSGSYTQACNTYSGCTRTYYSYYCSGTNTTTKPATPNTTTKYIDATAKDSYSCKVGTLTNDNRCFVKGSSSDAIIVTNYICPSGYVKNGYGSTSTCTKTNAEAINATAKTTQVTKYRYKWSKETTLEGWTRTGKTRKVATTETSSK